MKKRKIKLLEAVALTEDMPLRKLRAGEVGTVVELLGPDEYEVEFCDGRGETYAEFALRSEQIKFATDQTRHIERLCLI